MKKFAPLALIATVATLGAVPTAVFAAETTQPVHAATEQAAAPVEFRSGTRIYDVNGRALGRVYRVTSEGNPQIIIAGQMVTIPAETLSDADGKLKTSLERKDVSGAK